MAYRLAPVHKTIFINVSYHILVGSLTLMALFKNRYDTLMKIVLRTGASLNGLKLYIFSECFCVKKTWNALLASLHKNLQSVA